MFKRWLRGVPSEKKHTFPLDTDQQWFHGRPLNDPGWVGLSLADAGRSVFFPAREAEGPRRISGCDPKALADERLGRIHQMRGAFVTFTIFVVKQIPGSAVQKKKKGCFSERS